MSTATIKFLPPQLTIRMYGDADGGRAAAAQYLSEKHYVAVEPIDVPGLVGNDVAEEMFDLTNNPGRQDEREARYGRGRSVSVGDIVEVDGANWLCAPTGWIEL